MIEYIIRRENLTKFIIAKLSTFLEELYFFNVNYSKIRKEILESGTPSPTRTDMNPSSTDFESVMFF